MASRILLGGAILVLGALLVAGDDRFWIPALRSPQHRRYQSVELELKSVTECAFSDHSLADAVLYFADRHQIPIWLDERALTDEGISSVQLVTLNITGVTLQDALNLLLEPLGLTHVNDGELLIVTTRSKADERMTTRIYPVADLVDVGNGIDDYDSLVRAVFSISRSRWLDVDGEGGVIHPVDKAQSLVVRHTERVHREIDGLLQSLRQSKRIQRIPALPLQADFRIAEQSLPRSNSIEIERALRSPTDCSYIESPLDSGVVIDLADRDRVEIWIDRAALQDEGIPADLAMSATLSRISLQSALNLMLDPQGMTTLIEDDVLKITTKAHASQRLTVRTYPVGDLIDAGEGFDDYESLMKVVFETGGRQWMAIDGEGGEIHELENARSIVVCQTQDSHRQIEGVLSVLRRLRGLPDFQSISTPPGDAMILNPFLPITVRSPSGRPPALAFLHPDAIERALRTSVECSFEDRPLEEVARTLQRRLGIPIWIDQVALNSKGIACDCPVTLKCSGLSLDAALRKVLEPLKLDIVNQHEVLQITLAEQVDKRSFVRVYPIHDLARNQQESAALAGQLMNNIGQWEEFEGEGGRVSTCEHPRAFIIRQTQQTHRELESVLTSLRRTRGLGPIPSLATRRDEPAVLNPATVVRRRPDP